METCTKLFIVAMVLGLAVESEAIGIGMPDIGQGLCGMTKEGLMACAPYVTSLNPSPPSSDCCSALSKADLQCFCTFKNSRLLNLYGIDFSQALQLPVKCSLSNSSHC